MLKLQKEIKNRSKNIRCRHQTAFATIRFKHNKREMTEMEENEIHVFTLMQEKNCTQRQSVESQMF